MTDVQNLDPLAPEIRGGRFSLFDLYRSHILAGGGGVIENRVFENCVIEGPALVLVLDGTHFDGVDFGPCGGDMGGMLFRSLNGTMAIGSIPMRACTFRNCQFHNLGFTGNETLLKTLHEQVQTTG
ncbi:MAG: hypothetical protein K2X07_13060 [Caulobacteraceae bacterium]|nr:hypothetical protein [Caulobacteraceae bacterium]